MEEQIYRFSKQVEERIKKILDILEKKEEQKRVLENQLIECNKKIEEQKKTIENLKNEIFDLTLGNIKEISSDKKKEYLNEIDELIRAIDKIIKKHMQIK